MIAAVADTHTTIWYLFGDRRLSPTARRTIASAFASGEQIGVSAMTVVEVIYLSERIRVAPTILDVLGAAFDDGTLLQLLPMDRRVAERVHQVPRTDVPKLPDRVIAATAVQLGVPLITRDSRIQASGVVTLW